MLFRTSKKFIFICPGPTIKISNKYNSVLNKLICYSLLHKQSSSMVQLISKNSYIVKFIEGDKMFHVLKVLWDSAI